MQIKILSDNGNVRVCLIGELNSKVAAEQASELDKVLESADKAIEIDPSEVFGYYAKGWCHELSGDDSKAMVCYEQGIDMDKSYPYIFLMRGQIYLKRGETANAEADFEKVLQLDTVVTDGSCRQYALHYLGRDQEAEENASP